MKKTLILIVMLIAALLCNSALAADKPQYAYTNVPGIETQDMVLNIKAQVAEEGRTSDYFIRVQQPTARSSKILKEIIDAVQVNVLPAVSYYNEEIQAEIQALLPAGVDKDSLKMTEFISLMPPIWPGAGQVQVEISFDVDYEAGQTVAAVIGVEGENGEIEWKPLAAEVINPGAIRFEIPAEWHARIKGRETLLAILTDRIGGRGDDVVEPGPTQTPSKTAGDMTQVANPTDANGNALPDDFNIFTVEDSEIIRAEVMQISQHLQAKPIAAYFDKSMQERIGLLLSEAGVEDLLAYEVASLMAEGYQESYGDVLAGFTFATPFADKQEVVVALGIEKDAAAEGESAMEWTALRAYVQDGLVNVIFSQSVLSAMQDGAALMIVMSTPIVM